MVINAVLNFLIMASIIFFLIVKPVNALLTRIRKKEEAAPPPPPTPEVVLLTEIRDALQGKKPESPVVAPRIHELHLRHQILSRPRGSLRAGVFFSR